ncbi:MAG TPA: hypothetical protein P5519_06715 [Spirochaetia bacterium]|nr:hypothetical protein [Spirochaetia bacterium]
MELKKKDEVNRYFSWSLLIAVCFAVLIAVLSPTLIRFSKPEDQGSWWYYWQLANPTVWSRLSVWGLYIVHQLFIWWIVFRMFKEKNHPDSVSVLNKTALWGNFVFMGLHLLQTHVFYDGLAQDVPVWSSQWSVIIMLVIMIYLLIPRRGIVLGMNMPLKARVYGWIRKYHGAYISWALVYTFWFHPMEGDYGLLTGFFYMFLLFIQLSFAGTRIHTTIGWITVLELLVGLHGPAISLQKHLAEGLGSSIFADTWPMFLFGFVAVFVFTGQFGFKYKVQTRIAIFLLYTVAALVVYYFRGYTRLFEITFIPLALIGGAALLAVFGNIVSGKSNIVPVVKRN